MAKTNLVIDGVFMPDVEFIQFINAICSKCNNLPLGYFYSSKRNYSLLILETFGEDRAGNLNPASTIADGSEYAINKSCFIDGRWQNPKAILYYWIIWMFIITEIQDDNYTTASTIAADYYVKNNIGKRSDLLNDFIETMIENPTGQNKLRTENIVRVLEGKI